MQLQNQLKQPFKLSDVTHLAVAGAAAFPVAALVIMVFTAASGSNKAFDTLMASAATGDTSGCKYDVNLDGTVNKADLDAVAAHFGSSQPAGSSIYDVNADGSVNSADLGLVSSNSGKSCASNLPVVPSPVSQPSTAPSPAPSTTTTPTTGTSPVDKYICDSDVNKDGKVDDKDVSLVGANFGKAGVYDVNKDGKVTSADLGIVSANKGKTCSTATTSTQLFIAPGNVVDKAYVGLAICKLRGDVNADGIISSADMGLVVSNFGKQSKYDANGDGIITSADLGIVAANYGQRCNPQTVSQSVTSAVDTSEQQSAMCRFKGDVNGDGVVNSADMGLVTKYFGKRDTKYDTNGDGVITSADVAIVSASYGLRCK